MKVIVRLFAGISMLWATAAISAERDIEDFYGEFVGRSVADTENGVKARDISIAIKEGSASIGPRYPNAATAP
jgi:hypothetical protein